MILFSSVLQSQTGGASANAPTSLEAPLWDEELCRVKALLSVEFQISQISRQRSSVKDRVQQWSVCTDGCHGAVTSVGLLSCKVNNWRELKQYNMGAFLERS